MSLFKPCVLPLLILRSTLFYGGSALRPVDSETEATPTFAPTPQPVPNASVPDNPLPFHRENGTLSDDALHSHLEAQRQKRNEFWRQRIKEEREAAEASKNMAAESKKGASIAEKLRQKEARSSARCSKAVPSSLVIGLVGAFLWRVHT
eukprot:TRINITY_DN597_c0_g1_i1.p1 TRINITY_DN597_c0_g1~~TRINITY_DN597_c0_g1_i1.p1  ORF type:complete len:168 (-),score=24.11 TRINITY_DN597_c0_g1_i1:162-608(-)